jgi:LacI family transcriptional regulator
VHCPMTITLDEIARQVGVDTSLVSRVLRADPKARISREKRSKILALAEVRGYRPNRMARSLRTRRTHILAMLTPDITNPFHSFLFRAVERTASAAGYHVILCDTEDREERFRKVVATLAEGHVDGLLIATARHDDPAIDWVRARGLAYVLLNRRRSGTDHGDESWVGPDDHQTGWLAGDHLAALGHERIALLGGDRAIDNMRLREAGFRAALSVRGVAIQDDLIVTDLVDRAGGKTAAERLLRLPAAKRPTAIFAPHTLLAEGALSAVRSAGLRIPEDVSFVGYSASPDPEMTSICVPIDDIGRVATECLLNLLETGRADDGVPPDVVLPAALPVALVDRATTAPPRRR